MLRIRLLPAILGSLLAVFVLSEPADASIVQALDLDELAAEAEQIVLGRVLFSESFQHRNGQLGTWHRIGIEREVVGQAPTEDEIIIETLGGRIGDVAMRVEGEASFTVGERVLVFIQGGGPYSASRAVGMGQGVMRVRSEQGVDTVRQSREGLMLVRRDLRGRLKQSAGALPEPERLDTLLERLRDMTGKRGGSR